ncbi:hypothetical protein O181_019024 [Austropuccinia psidii MF-1]|uniref:Uncharacterized protein n=1 Tax=Austropuccinia psidii MF-1 TaxID=1389203 RepID=A0A9Q3C6A1_9BASI|nr:hypothetical protein [Austropuccinia psidii MF-1]
MNSIPFCAACKKTIQLKPSPSLFEDFQHTTARPAQLPDETNSRNDLPAPEPSTSPITPSLNFNHLTADTNWPVLTNTLFDENLRNLHKTFCMIKTTNLITLVNSNQNLLASLYQNKATPTNKHLHLHLTKANSTSTAPSHVIVQKQPYNNVQSLTKPVASTSTTVDNVTSP